MVPISSCFLLSLYSFCETATACCSTFTFSRAYTSSQYAVMVLVTVVMACCMNTRSAILRLFLAMMMLRRLTSKQQPLSSCWEMVAVSDEVTDGFKRLAVGLLEPRLLSQATLKVVPEVNPCE